MSPLPKTKPRFAGCPPICDDANLPMFESESALHQWMAKISPRAHITSVFQCGDHWHARTTANGPSGDSSGHSRFEKHKQKYKL